MKRIFVLIFFCSTAACMQKEMVKQNGKELVDEYGIDMSGSFPVYWAKRSLEKMKVKNLNEPEEVISELDSLYKNMKLGLALSRPSDCVQYDNTLFDYLKNLFSESSASDSIASSNTKRFTAICSFILKGAKELRGYVEEDKRDDRPRCYSFFYKPISIFVPTISGLFTGFAAGRVCKKITKNEDSDMVPLSFLGACALGFGVSGVLLASYSERCKAYERKRPQYEELEKNIFDLSEKVKSLEFS